LSPHEIKEGEGEKGWWRRVVVRQEEQAEEQEEVVGSDSAHALSRKSANYMID
jgi:hypothetical protein